MTAANHDPEQAPQTAALIPILKRVGLTIVFLWFTLGGVAHFSLTEAEMRIVPPSLEYLDTEPQSVTTLTSPAWIETMPSMSASFATSLEIDPVP